MASQLQTPKKLVLVCPPGCSLHPDKIGQAVSEALLAIRANGGGRPALIKRGSELLGRPIPNTVMQRHVDHFRELADDTPQDGPRPGDVAILDSIIAAGYRNSKNWKPTIKDTLDAMKLKVQMTGQSAFEDMLAAMEAADLDLGDADDGSLPPEAPEAIFSPDERTPEEE